MNDFAGTTYTPARLFPMVKEAYLQLQLFLRGAGDPRFNVALADSSQYIPVAIGVKNITASLGQDSFTPVKLWERYQGSTDLVIPMEERDWEPSIEQQDRLRFWVFRNGIIRFIGATVANEVRVDYVTGFATLSTVGSTIGAESGEAFLAPWTASLCARYIQGNIARADELKALAIATINNIIQLRVGKNQSLPVRSGRYKGFKQTAW